MVNDEIELARQPQVSMAAQANHARYQPGQRAGHYESFFLRANHPTRPLAFWIRYTLFSPDRRPQDAIGELWAVLFDGNTGGHVAVKREAPFSQCSFKTTGFGAQIDDARLEPGQLQGAATSSGHTIAWTLAYSGADQPLFLLPLNFYTSAFPKAKSLGCRWRCSDAHRAAPPGPGDGAQRALADRARARVLWLLCTWDRPGV